MSKKDISSKFILENSKKFIFFLFSISCFLFFAPSASAAILSLSPSTGTFTVGSTFEVSVFLNTEDQSANTIVAAVDFPADKLQLVSPSAGKSIVEIWLTPPKFNNQTGKVELKGGVPNGINVSGGLIAQLTFRVKGPGRAILKFLDDSTVLLNDGRGTEDLRHTQGAVYDFVLPPPAGPIVVSSTHPDQSKWYRVPNAILEWASNEDISAFSYILNQDVVDLPDDVSEGINDSVLYKNLSDGGHYFHIKALRNQVWGGVTHYVLNIDSSPPADFSINIIPDTKTSRRQVVAEFQTTDKWSGVERYELKLVPLTQKNEVGPEEAGNSPFFIEVSSPYVTSGLDLGKYDLVVRAYDGAGNYKEVVQKIEIVNPFFRLIGDEGLEIRGIFMIPWMWLWIIFALIILLLALLGWYISKRHSEIEMARGKKWLPSGVKDQLGELKKYREKYGKIAVFIFVFLASFLFSGGNATAANVELSPPIATIISKNISNEEIFYIGGKTELAQTEVVIYLQNLKTGETVSQKAISDNHGDWFYRHDQFLASGNYLLWAQSKIGEEMSPPGPQISIIVRSTALQLGASRISYELFYALMVVAMGIVLLTMIAYVVYRGRQLKKKHKIFTKEVMEAEEAVRTGFAILHRDIEAELAAVAKIKAKKEFTDDLKEKELQLLSDLKEVERYIGKEVFDIEKAEYTG